MLDKVSVLNIIKERGPVIPRDIMKLLGGDTFLIGAILSQLKDSGQVRISSVKIGGSPVYYLPTQESKLTELYKNLHDQEKKAYDLLKQHGILQDSVLEPVTRVALRGIKDYAKPVEVTIKDNKIIFWRWFLLPNEKAEATIREKISAQKDEVQELPKGGMPINAHVPEKTIEKKEETIVLAEQPKPAILETKKEEQKTSIIKEPVIEKKEVPEHKKETVKHEKEHEKEIQIELKEEDNADNINDSFLTKIKRHFDKNEIKIIEYSIIKKAKEIDLIITVPSAAGRLNFFCRAKDKKTINEGDLSTAYVIGENKKLPILFVTTGKLTKKTESMLSKEFKNITVNKI
ncbi:MAG: hypothetical protein V1859_08695 [archaeon]